MHKKKYPLGFILTEFSFRKGQNVLMVLSPYLVPEETFTQCIYFKKQAIENVQHHKVIEQYGRARFGHLILMKQIDGSSPTSFIKFSFSL